MRYLTATVAAHRACRDRCLRCKKPKDPDKGFFCDECKAEAKQAGKEVEIPNFSADEELSRTAEIPDGFRVTRRP
jgi:hypothetical protein